MLRLIAGALIAAILACAPVAAQQENAMDAPRDVIAELLGQDSVSAERFTPAFLEQVPISQIEALLAQVRSTIGATESVIPRGDSYVVRTRTHTMPVEISLTADGRISRLLFRPPVQRNASIADIAAQFDELEGAVSYLVLRDGEEMASSRADDALAVGSAFKLGVIGVAQQRVADGALGWSDVLRLDARHVSLPSGLLQTFPSGAPVTVHTASALMISISDNTATDLLMDALGREAVAEQLGIEFALTTREFFFLKGDIEMREAYLAADTATKAEIAQQMAARELPALNPNLPLHDEGVEWYVSARTLCTLIEDVADLDVMQINPGVADPAQWQSVAYKGGSETGVLNMTTYAVGQDGSRNCVVLTINAAQPIQATTPTSIYASILAALSPQDTD
ncbi:serine hydrolase [Devosia pacifica]|uniref:Serine hydrolase n=1 Tax=Devosia pacifica TaxID=1335967 RepID=A0A918S4J3_9HYPH|nr:serine hydrolase [Devosia pacifica]GHA20966.1 serine hydrolase [Devosia pacifica]